MKEEELYFLIEKYLDGKATPAEEEKLLQWYRNADHGQIKVPVESENEMVEIKMRMLGQLHSNIDAEKATLVPIKRNYGFRRWVAAAAAIFIIAGGATWYMLSNNKAATNPVASGLKIRNDIQAPDKSKATITLSNGSIISLDSVGNGTLATQNDINVIKTADGKIVYQGSQLNADGSQLSYNTLYNPRGSKAISVTLNDGTKIWLNCQSSLKYPVAFTGNERRVEITGEAYFEVAKDAARKFIVNANNKGEVEVFGTHFNVMAYENEGSMQTTLLEGSIKFSSAGKTQMLKPGQQTTLSNDGQIKLVDNADIDLAMAWKNGVTAFKSADIKTIMRQVERWYDVDVSYEGPVPQRNFTGEIPREVNISELLKLFQVSKIRFTIDGTNKKLVVIQ